MGRKKSTHKHKAWLGNPVTTSHVYSYLQQDLVLARAHVKLLTCTLCPYRKECLQVRQVTNTLTQSPIQTQPIIENLVLDRPQFLYSALRPLRNRLRQRARPCHLILTIASTFHSIQPHASLADIPRGDWPYKKHGTNLVSF